MARKIRVTESELVNMIEDIITTEKRNKNTIKLTESDLKNIIKKVNEKINLHEKIDNPTVEKISNLMFGKAEWKRIEDMASKNAVVTGDIIEAIIKKLAAAGAKLKGGDAQLGIKDLKALATAGGEETPAPVAEGIMDALKGLFGKSPDSPKGEKWMVTYRDSDYSQNYSGYSSETEARQSMSDLASSHNQWKGRWDVKQLS